MIVFPDEGTRGGTALLDRLRYETRSGRVTLEDKKLVFTLAGSDGTSYSNAQIDDYHTDGAMVWRPPVRLVVRARFSHAESELRGTAGFGFWNDPFGMTKIGGQPSWLPRLLLPQVVWFFFASPPSDMPFAMGVPGYGWKAATMDATSVLSKVLMPFAPAGALLCRIPWVYRRLWPLAQRVLKVDEKMLRVKMDEWHEYSLEWERDRVRFVVDGQVVLTTRFAPRGPLGFVAWMDNQAMVATPQARFRHEALAVGKQWMEIAAFEVK